MSPPHSFSEVFTKIASEDVTFYIFYSLVGSYMLYFYSATARPVEHPDRELGTKHRETEAERVKILERLISRSQPDDSKLKAGDDVRPLSIDVLDVEKEPLNRPLLSTSIKAGIKEANLATISLRSNGSRAPSKVLDSMMEVSETTKCEEFVDDNFFCSAKRTAIQTTVELHGGMIDRLKDLVKKSTTPPPKEFTPILQVDSWAILQQSGKEVKLLRLPTDKLPVILHAEYAAGLLTVTGLNLEDAEIFASAESANYTLKLKVYRFFKSSWTWNRFSNTAEDVAILPFQLTWRDMNKVFIYATKKVHLGEDGKPVDVMSKAVRILDSFWMTVFMSWIPIIVLWIFTIYNIRALLLTIPEPYQVTSLFSSAPITGGFNIIFFIILNPFSRVTVEFFKYHWETLFGGLGRGLMVFYYGFKGLKGPRLEFPKDGDVRKVPVRVTPAPAPTRPSGPSAIKSDPEATNAKSIDDPDWEWPAYDKFEDKYGKSELRRRCNKALGDEVSPFRAIYRRKKAQLWPDVVEIGLYSAPLISIVQKLLPQNGDLQCLLENPTVDGRELFTVLDDMRNHIKAPSSWNDTLLEKSHEVGQDEGKGKLHLKHLLRFMDKEYGDVSVRVQRMTEEKSVTWDMLWTFLTPGRKVVYNCDHSQEMLAAVVSKNSYSLVKKESWSFSIELDIWDYDGRKYKKCQIQRTIEKFDGERAFSSLAVRPIEMEGDPEVLYESFLANGKRFYELAMTASHRFMHYSGPMFRQVENKPGYLQVMQENADGRVMIDLANFAKMTPRNRLGNSLKARVARLSGSLHPSMDPQRMSVVENEEGQDVAQFALGPIQVSDETLIFAPAIVYGFSFTLKEWGRFAVSGFSEISFNSNAFDSLVMEPDSKQLVYNLVSQYIATPVVPSEELQTVDHISRKGEGCVFLCYGPPGTGKTLTAESVAENMHRPLWSLSVSELGTSPSTLEKNLFKVLDISATWRAVVLLDEADCFLEKRIAATDLTRNSMAGVFLRFLEYHRGVLFLTTNRIETLDNAFRSRISMFLHYPKLSIQHRERIWTTLLERAGVTGITAEFVSQVAAEDLNGREIRNTIHTAQMWAKSNGQTLDVGHVRHLTTVLVSSLETLSDTINSSECD